MNAGYLNLSLLPFAADEIKRAEQMFTKGEDKLKAVLSHVRSVYESTSGPAAFGITFDELQPQMTEMVEALVGYNKSVGDFNREQKLAA